MFIYLLPVYIYGFGNCTIVGDKGGERILRKELIQTLTRIYKEHNYDIDVVFKKSQKKLKQKNLIPLFDNNLKIYIPIKIRNAILKGDGCHGYINLNYLLKIIEGIILLKEGQAISFIERSESLLNRLYLAELLKKQLVKKHLTNPTYT